MYLRSLHIRNLKLLRDFRLDFTDAHGQPRMWTVLLAENGLCKTSILQAIALAACGPARASSLADVWSLPDKRLAAVKPTVEIDAEFGFSASRHGQRSYPGLSSPPGTPPVLHSHLQVRPGRTDFAGYSRYLGDPSGNLLLDQLSASGALGVMAARLGGPLDEARSQNLSDWFVAGYGTNRNLLPVSVGVTPASDPSLDRVESLFGRRALLGTGFADLFAQHYGDKDWALRFSQDLRSALLSGEGLLPKVQGIDLRGRGGGGRAANLNESQRIDFLVASQTVRLAAIQLSQGYQSMLAWVADLIGQIYLQAQDAVAPADMEGLVLLDELDLHLHPRWQVQLVRTLRRAFPRMQFVTTTHSPMVLPWVHQHELFILRQSEEGHVTATPAPESPALLTGGGLYDRFFGLPEIFPADIGDTLWQYRYLSADPGRSPQQTSQLRALRDKLIADGLDPGPEPPPSPAAAPDGQAAP